MTEKATFAMGCFWKPQMIFEEIEGVKKTLVGYVGGEVKNPSYEQVCTGRTGHLEAIEITFDPKVVSYEELLEVFWKNHDPTTMNRQGFDVGSEYNSAIFYHTEEQKKMAEKSREEEQKHRKKKITTEIRKAEPFYKAEEYHQHFLEKRSKGMFW